MVSTKCSFVSFSIPLCVLVSVLCRKTIEIHLSQLLTACVCIFVAQDILFLHLVIVQFMHLDVRRKIVRKQLGRHKTTEALLALVMETGSGQSNRRYRRDFLNIEERHRGLGQIGIKIRIDEFDVGIGGGCGHRFGASTRWYIWTG